MESDTLSATTPDWTREHHRGRWDPGRRLLRSIRRHQAWKGRGLFGRWLSKYWAVEHRFWSAVTGADIPLGCNIGGGLLLTHPNGVVIHPRVRIGVNCLIFQQVTIGTGGRLPGVAVLEGHVEVGAGAKILGGVTIGNHARIGANAVVLDDVPEGATAVGVPARVIRRGLKTSQPVHDRSASARGVSDADPGPHPL